MDRFVIEKTAKAIVDSAFKVHRHLGPGLLESSYRRCLAYELRHRGHEVREEVALPLKYYEIKLEAGYRVDMIVDALVLVENKAVDELAPVHVAQVLTYLRLSKLRLGFLLNWHVTRFRDGVRRLVLNL